MNTYKISGYVDKLNKGKILGVNYLGNDDVLENLLKVKKVRNAVIGVGAIKDNSIRRSLQRKLLQIWYTFPKIVSPDASINEGISIAEGTVVMDGAVVNSGTEIGSFAIINTNSSIDHDCKIGDCVHIAPGATLSGGVKVGDNSLIGTGATITQYRTIGKNCIIGAGAVVSKDCLETGTYFGVPATKRN